MSKLICFCLSSLLVFCQISFSQEYIPLSPKGDISFMPVKHASLILNIRGTKFFIDPYGEDNEYKNAGKPDLVLITDIHPDHYSESTLKQLDLSEAKFIVPKAVHDKMPTEWAKKSVVLNNGERITIADVAIRTLPMYNLPESQEAYHVKGRGNGYLIDVDGLRIYISGDTEDTPEMRALSDIDVAFICMNLPYTMSIESAADAVNAFKPAVVYPYHYRNGDKTLADTEKFKSLVGEGVEVRLLDWYPKPE